MNRCELCDEFNCTCWCDECGLAPLDCICNEYSKSLKKIEKYVAINGYDNLAMAYFAKLHGKLLSLTFITEEGD